MRMSAIPIVHLFAGLAIYWYFDPNALAAVVGIEWLSARVSALSTIGPHHAAFFLAIFPTLLFSLVYFLPANRAKIEARLPPKPQEFFNAKARPPIPLNWDDTVFTAACGVITFLVQFSGVIEGAYSQWWGMLFPGVLLITWMGAVGMVMITLLQTGLIKR